jgi:iron complex transport system substrate-binding protein
MVRIFCILILVSSFGCYKSHEKKGKSSRLADSLTNKHANGFFITQNHDSIVLSIVNPWQKANEVVLNYLLIKRKNSSPTIEFHVNRISIPVSRVVCMSTTHIAFIDALGELNSIIGLSGAKLVNNTYIRKKLKEGSIVDVGYEQSINYELLVKLKPDVVFSYGVGSEVSGYINKLNELGIPVVLVGEYLETDPLAKAEWLRFFAEFYNKRNIAEEIIDTINFKYQKLKESLSKIKNKPTVMAGLPWNGTWFVSGGKSYAAKLIEDAGGNYLWKDLNSRESLPMDMETIYKTTSNADYWLNTGSAVSRKDILSVDQRLGLLQPFKTGQIFNNNARLNETGGNDYWESGVLNPHVILHDLIVILHPELTVDKKLIYYKKLDNIKE